MASFESAGSSDSAPLKLNIVDFIRIGGGPPILQAWDVHTTNTIGMLKAKIQDKLGILVRKQVIVHGKSNKKLRNCSAVADLGHATLHLVHNNSVLMEKNTIILMAQVQAHLMQRTQMTATATTQVQAHLMQRTQMT